MVPDEVARMGDALVAKVGRFVPESCGPFKASVGNVPYICPPFTAPPITMWCDPHAWLLPVFEFGWNVREKSDIVNVVTLLYTPNSCVT